MTTYKPEKPEVEQREVFFDQTGEMHVSRDQAIRANIRDDLSCAIRIELIPMIRDDADKRKRIAEMFIEKITLPDSAILKMIKALIKAQGEE